MPDVYATYSYTLIDNNTKYSILCTNPTTCTIAVIPSEYNNLPVTNIGSTAFRNSNTLTRVIIPDSITTIDEAAFDTCSNLTSVEMGSGVTSIGNIALRRCSSLTKILIPSNLTELIGATFYNCVNLVDITLLPTTVPTLGQRAFEGISANAKFYCLSSVIDNYKSATNWNTYADKIIADDIRIYFILNSISAKSYFAKKNDLIDKQDKATYETKSILTTDWTALANSTPYTYSATVTATATISADTVVELINDNPVLFATYGFAIASVSGQNITIYSIGAPDNSVSLEIAIGG